MGRSIGEKGTGSACAIPYYMPRSGYITMPKLTQTMGPWLRPTNCGYARGLSEQKRMLSALIEQLPCFQRLQQNLHHSVTNWLAFYWRDFQQYTRYTYIISLAIEMEKVCMAFDSSVRGKIRKAEKIVFLRDGDLRKYTP